MKYVAKIAFTFGMGVLAASCLRAAVLAQDVPVMHFHAPTRSADFPFPVTGEMFNDKIGLMMHAFSCTSYPLAACGWMIALPLSAADTMYLTLRNESYSCSGVTRAISVEFPEIDPTASGEPMAWVKCGSQDAYFMHETGKLVGNIPIWSVVRHMPAGE